MIAVTSNANAAASAIRTELLNDMKYPLCVAAFWKPQTSLGLHVLDMNPA
jgi:hypothetical protein